MFATDSHFHLSLIFLGKVGVELITVLDSMPASKINWTKVEVTDSDKRSSLLITSVKSFRVQTLWFYSVKLSYIRNLKNIRNKLECLTLASLSSLV